LPLGGVPFDNCLSGRLAERLRGVGDLGCFHSVIGAWVLLALWFEGCEHVALRRHVSWKIFWIIVVFRCVLYAPVLGSFELHAEPVNWKWKALVPWPSEEHGVCFC